MASGWKEHTDQSNKKKRGEGKNMAMEKIHGEGKIYVKGEKQAEGKKEKNTLKKSQELPG